MKFLVHAKVLSILEVEAKDEADAKRRAEFSLERLEMRSVGLGVMGQEIEIVEAFPQEIDPKEKL